MTRYPYTCRGAARVGRRPPPCLEQGLLPAAVHLRRVGAPMAASKVVMLLLLGGVHGALEWFRMGILNPMFETAVRARRRSSSRGPAGRARCRAGPVRRRLQDCDPHGTPRNQQQVRLSMPPRFRSSRRAFAKPGFVRRSHRSDGIADALLPDTYIAFAYRDSKRDDSTGLSQALWLVNNAFDAQGGAWKGLAVRMRERSDPGQREASRNCGVLKDLDAGQAEADLSARASPHTARWPPLRVAVQAIIGADSSSVSIAAALVTASLSVPQLSYASTAPILSNGNSYTYFARVVPSDAYQTSGMADLLVSMFGYTRVAT
eukprot:309610-Prymnesium_polylepis.1